MKKNNREAARIAGYISGFLHDYAPQFLTSSEHTLILPGCADPLYRIP